MLLNNSPAESSGNTPLTTALNYEMDSAQIAAIPNDLKALSQWVCWRYEECNGKRTKPPISAKSNEELRYARTNDPSTWGSMDEALETCGHHGLNGIGLCLAEDDGLTGIDLDHVFDPATGEIDPLAAEVLTLFASTYTEISPGGDGLRIWCRGKPPRSGKCVGKVKWLEVYSHPSNRFLTVTGNHWSGSATEITEQQDALDWLHEAFMKESAKPAGPPPQEGGGTLEDDVLLEKARSARNGEAFARLWEGDTSQQGNDHSSADLALCGSLAFWTGRNAEQMDRLFRQSGLMRDKWDDRHSAEGRTYGEMTLAKAIEDCTQTYQPPLVGRVLEAAQEGLDEALTALEGRWADETTRGAVRQDARTLLNAQGRVLAALKAHQLMDYKAVRARMMPLVDLAKYEFNIAVRQAAAAAAAAERLDRGQGDGQRSEWLKNYVYLMVDNCYADLRDGGILKPEAFVKVAEQAIPHGWEDAAAPVLHAREQNPQVRHEGYYPGEPRLVTNKESTIGIIEPLLNTYNAPRDLPEPRYDAGQESLFLDHLMYVCGREEEFVQALLNWMAYIIQYPGKRINWVPLIIGPKGNGKTFIADLMTAMLGKSNVGILSNDDLSGAFQDGLAFKQLLVLEEFKVFEGQNAMIERFKPWVTNTRVGMNRKGRSKITVDNVANTMAFSNHENAIRIDKQERRYAVAISRGEVKDEGYYKTLFGTFIPGSGGSVASVLYLLKHRDLSAFNPYAPAIHTASRDEMIENNHSALEREMAQYIKTRDTERTPELFTFAQVKESVEYAQRVTSLDMHGKPLSNNVIASAARAAGIEKMGPKRIGEGKEKTVLYVIRNHAAWRDASEGAVREYLQQFHARQEELRQREQEERWEKVQEIERERVRRYDAAMCKEAPGTTVNPEGGITV